MLPVNVKVPEFVRVTALAAPVTTVLSKVIAVPVKEIAAVVSSAPLKSDKPLPAFCVMEAARICWLAVTLFAVLMVKAPIRAVATPTFALKRIEPVPDERVRSFPPSTVLAKLIPPAPDPLSKFVAPASVIAPEPENRIGLFVVTIEPLSEKAPVLNALSVKPPVAEIFALFV